MLARWRDCYEGRGHRAYWMTHAAVFMSPAQRPIAPDPFPIQVQPRAHHQPSPRDTSWLCAANDMPSVPLGHPPPPPHPAQGGRQQLAGAGGAVGPQQQQVAVSVRRSAWGGLCGLRGGATGM